MNGQDKKSGVAVAEGQKRKTKKQEQRRAWIILILLVAILGWLSSLYVQAHFPKNKNRKNNYPSSQDIGNIRSQVSSSIQLLEEKPDLETLNNELSTLEESISKVVDPNIETGDPNIETGDPNIETGDPNIETIRNLLQQLKNNNIDSLPPEEQQNYAESLLTRADNELQEIEKELQEIEKNVDNSFFWSEKPLLWVEIAFWGFVGTTLYLLSEIYGNYNGNYKGEDPIFIELTPWYFITLLRGTFVVFFIILGLTTVNIEIGVSISFTEASAEFYVFIAGVLGYFNRVAKEQLKIIFKSLFSQAWDAANPGEKSNVSELKITPPNVELAFNEQQTFKVEPLEKVKWSIEPDIEPDNVGEITEKKDSEMTYTAPAQSNTTSVTIIATSVDNPSRKATAIITLQS